MARPRRLDVPGGIHHVMNRGVNRGDIFFADEDRVEFGRRLAEIHCRYGVETLAYCLMGNHYHLLLRAVQGGLPAAMHHLGSVYTRHTNDRVGRDGPLFRGRYHAILVTTDPYLLWVTRYIHRNPLDLPGVTSASSYRWSSYRVYLGLRPSPGFLNTGVVLAQFESRRDLGDFTETSRCERRTWTPSTFDDLLQLVRFALAQDDLEHGDDLQPAPQWRERTIMVLLAEDEMTTTPTELIERHLAFPSPGARRMAVGRARRRWETDPTIRRVLAALQRTECA